MLDLTDFIKEYVEELHRKQNALVMTSDEIKYVQSMRDECITDGSTKTLEAINPLTSETTHEVWKDSLNVYEFFFDSGKVYSLNIYDRVKYEV